MKHISRESYCTPLPAVVSAWTDAGLDPAPLAGRKDTTCEWQPTASMGMGEVCTSVCQPGGGEEKQENEEPAICKLITINR